MACPSLVEHIEKILQQDSTSKLIVHRDEEQNGTVDKEATNSFDEGRSMSGQEALDSLRNGLKGLNITTDANGRVGPSSKGIYIVLNTICD